MGMLRKVVRGNKERGENTRRRGVTRERKKGEKDQGGTQHGIIVREAEEKRRKRGQEEGISGRRDIREYRLRGE